MTRKIVLLGLSAVLATAALTAQTTPSATDLNTSNSSSLPPASVLSSPSARPRATAYPYPAPFSRVAIEGGVSAMGINLQTAVNLERHLNLRGTGNFFNYTVNNISTHGFNVTGTLNLAAAGVSLDYFPFPRHGLRISPGVLFYNQNEVRGAMVAAGGTSFTLNSVNYYSSPSSPVTGLASLDLHKQNPAPSLSLGWGNLIPRNGGHWSFPVEVGAAYIGHPLVAMSFVSGQVCADAQGTVGCQNVVGNSSVNSNLQAQVAKDQKSLNPYPFYPIVSFGVGYSFGGRRRATVQ